jgi:peptide deformylase
MTLKPILQEGAPQLALSSKPIEIFGTRELKDLIENMLDTMRSGNGVGIAGPQIGVNLRVIVVGFEKSDRYPGEEPIPIRVIVNPKFEVLDATKEKGVEGCLSVPGVRGLVPRFKSIRYGGYDVEGNPIDFEASGFHARIVQHECDHLDGILFTARVEDKKDFIIADQSAEPGDSGTTPQPQGQKAQ